MSISITLYVLRHGYSGLPFEAPSTTEEQDSVLLITGGYPKTSTTELFPSIIGCSPPPLPSTRWGHKTFLTSDPIPLVATCGGTTEGYTASCLVLDAVNQRWDESRMGNLTVPRSLGAVAVLKHIGVFYLGGISTDTSSDFLPAGSLQWQQGPSLPMAMSYLCAIPITPTSFITIHKDKIHEFDAAIAGPKSAEGWRRESGRWERLKTSRTYYPGCAKVGNKVIIAGGEGNGRKLQSTEVLDITTRTLLAGGDMASPRNHFCLATIRSGGQDKSFALAGHDGSSKLNTVEEWVEESSSWKEAEILSRARYYFGVVALLPKQTICPA